MRISSSVSCGNSLSKQATWEEYSLPSHGCGRVSLEHSLLQFLIHRGGRLTVQPLEKIRSMVGDDLVTSQEHIKSGLRHDDLEVGVTRGIQPRSSLTLGISSIISPSLSSACCCLSWLLRLDMTPPGIWVTNILQSTPL